MPRARSPERDLAYQLWLDSGKKKKLKDIAEELGVPEGKVRKWKSLDNWEGNVPIQRKGNVPKREVHKSAKRLAENQELTDQQKLFCIYFSKTFNATSAYQKAYGCSYAAALTNGPRMLRNARIADEIQRLKKERYAQALLSVQIPNPETGEKETLMQNVNVVRLKESRDVDTTLIGEVKQGRDGITVKLPDRMKALEWLADHMDMATPEQKAKTEKLRAETDRIRRSSLPEQDDGVEIINDAPRQEDGQDLGHCDSEVPGDI